MIDFYVLISFGNTHLSILKSDLRNVEVIEDVETKISQEDIDMNIVGWIEHERVLSLGKEHFPVFEFSDGLKFINKISTKRNFCAILQSSDTAFGITCDQFKSLPSGYRLHIEEVPASMKLFKHSPITKFAIYDEKIYYVMNAKALFNYITMDWYNV
jgi:hypothetical protein